MKLHICALAALLTLAAGGTAPAKMHHHGVAGASGLAGTTVLIIRHAEKPDTGTELAPAGVQRAQAYVAYFSTFRWNGQTLLPEYLIAAKDSKSSVRPRLTIEPLSQALHERIHQRYANMQFAGLASELQTKHHARVILIAWHHGEIPNLVQALGVDPTTIFPAPKWPADVFGWVVVIHYDRSGKPDREELVMKT